MSVTTNKTKRTTPATLTLPQLPATIDRHDTLDSLRALGLPVEETPEIKIGTSGVLIYVRLRDEHGRMVCNNRDALTVPWFIRYTDEDEDQHYR